MPDLIRHPVLFWIPAFAGMTDLGYLIAGVIMTNNQSKPVNHQLPIASYK